MREFEKKSLHDRPAPIPPPTKHIIDDEDHVGVGQHLPFHRLKLKPVNRLSCVVDYETGGETLKMVERNGSGDAQERRSVNSRGLVVTGGGGTLGRRRKERPGVQTGGSGGSGGEDKTWGLCYLCLEPASIQCTWCREAELCSEACLRHHRPHTKCLPLRVVSTGNKGRGLAASRDIRARETILSEAAALTGPSLVTAPVCPGCLAPCRPPLVRCSLCSLPVCSPVCAASPSHRPECKLLSENRVKIPVSDANCDSPAPIYSFITAYRLLMLRHVSSDTWGRVARLPDHLQARASTSEFDSQQTEIVNFLRRRCFLAKQFSDEDIHRAIGIISVNSVSLEPRRLFSGPSKGRTGIQGRGIFPTFALCNHSCVGNARFTLEAGNSIRVEARAAIRAGEEITVQYYSSLLGTHKRRRRLRSEWYFDCECQRCVDPTELGTFVSAVTCEACEAGHLLPRDPLDCYSEWPCDKCDFSLEVPDLERKIDQLEEELNYLSTRKDLRRLEQFITDLSGPVLHPQHYLLLIARRNYKYISQKQLIAELARCEAGAQEAIKEDFRRRLRMMSEYDWVPKLLLGEE